jgi:UDP-GlcNAc:undecaprenyl-phosphate/decaprenyl-phosphate GlcNAc-1-phosphate transferase
MLTFIAASSVLSFAFALPLVWYARHLGRKLQALDSAGVPGQTKAPARKIPNTGGLGLFWAINLPLVAALLLIVAQRTDVVTSLVPAFQDYLPQLEGQVGTYAWLIIAAASLHVLGLLDDRRPMSAWPKLLVMLLVAASFTHVSDWRLLTLLDPHVGGTWASVLLTTVWIVVVLNAMNFIDNMDGLCAGVSAICASALCVAAISAQQWFVAAMLAAIAGACLGFLCWNFPFSSSRRATVFLGDGGSLTLGFLLACLAVRITYTSLPAADPSTPLTDANATSLAASVLRPHTGWFGVFTPLVILAVPLYDLISVTILRTSQGKSPFVGDLQHLSHRLHLRGLSQRASVLVIYGLTGITCLASMLLPNADTPTAIIIATQTALTLTVLAIIEFRPRQPAPISIETRSHGSQKL